jgi:hypothetical protein
VQPQLPAETVFSDCEPGELNTESCFSTAELSHFGQLTFSRAERTMVSKLWWQRQQLYSKIGIKGPRSVSEFQTENLIARLAIITPKHFWLWSFFASQPREADYREG